MFLLDAVPDAMLAVVATFLQAASTTTTYMVHVLSCHVVFMFGYELDGFLLHSYIFFPLFSQLGSKV